VPFIGDVGDVGLVGESIALQLTAQYLTTVANEGHPSTVLIGTGCFTDDEHLDVVGIGWTISLHADSLSRCVETTVGARRIYARH